MSQAADTYRVKIDDRCWRVECANPDCQEGEGGRPKIFEATRSDASYCCGKCRQWVHDAPKRKQAAIDELRQMQQRIIEIERKYKGSQDVLDAMIALKNTVVSSVNLFDVQWNIRTLPISDFHEVK